MISEEQISLEINRIIKSPIRIGNLTELGIDEQLFLKFYQPIFDNLEDDIYLIKEKQLSFLKSKFTTAKSFFDKNGKDYFEGKLSIDIFNNWLEKLNKNEKEAFKELSFVTRKRNISSFNIEFVNEKLRIERISKNNFTQEVDDFRAWKRIFKQAKKEEVENELFHHFLIVVAKLVKNIHPNINMLKITSHFMRTICNTKIKGENSPEGIHEDGSDYIISALVINRDNSGNKNVLFSRELKVGEFAFQADTGEEKTFGNDLWHYVTPIEPIDLKQVGIRDIIGLDIVIPK